jgi:hypothetical protein
MTACRPGTVAVVLVLVGAAAHYVLVELHRPGVPANDVYAYFVPNVLLAVQAAAHGGRGLLWNPWQSCGEPFFGNAATGLLYPLHWLFLLLETNRGVEVVQMLNMLIGAVGMFLLGLRVGASRPAALAGAVVFELGYPMAELAAWSPMHAGPWAWVPWAMLCAERLLARPSWVVAGGLAVVLTLQVLPGFVLISALTCQLVVLRVVWDLLTRPAARPWLGALQIAVGLALAPMLAAVQLLPMAEFARESLRAGLSAVEMLRPAEVSRLQFLDLARRRIGMPLLMAPLLLAVLAPHAPRTRRIAVFYLCAAALFAVLGLGNMTPLFGWYVVLPPGASTLRMAIRLFWITGFCLGPLTALGIDAVRGSVRPVGAGLVVAVAALGAVLYAYAPGGLHPAEALALLAVVAAVLAATLLATPPAIVGAVLIAAVGVNVIAVPISYRGRLQPSLASLYANAPLFASLAPSVGDQGRVFVAPDGKAASSFELMAKTSSVFRVPGVFDYEALFGRRFTEYFTMLRTGRAGATLMDVYWPAPWLTAGARRRLLDAAAVRYVVASTSVDVHARVLGLEEVANAGTPTVRVYRNPGALPRARWVPRVEVVPDADQLLRRLAFGDDDLSRLALLEQEPPSGFHGTADEHAVATSRLLVNDPEHLAIVVDAPTRGFLVLADQHYPGWRATVNDRPVPILRANYLFGAIEVPAGRSRIDFRFVPHTLVAGALISGLTALGLALAAWRAARA